MARTGGVMRIDGAYLDVMRLHKEGFCCSQIIAIMALKVINENNEGLVKAKKQPFQARRLLPVSPSYL